MSLPVVPSNKATLLFVEEAGHTTSPLQLPPVIVTVTSFPVLVAVTPLHTKLKEDTVLVSVVHSSFTAMFAVAVIVTSQDHNREVPFTVFMLVPDTNVSCFQAKSVVKFVTDDCAIFVIVLSAQDIVLFVSVAVAEFLVESLVLSTFQSPTSVLVRVTFDDRACQFTVVVLSTLLFKAVVTLVGVGKSHKVNFLFTHHCTITQVSLVVGVPLVNCDILLSAIVYFVKV
jgi:hypothetical protein